MFAAVRKGGRGSASFTEKSFVYTELISSKHSTDFLNMEIGHELSRRDHHCLGHILRIHADSGSVR